MGVYPSVTAVNVEEDDEVNNTAKPTCLDAIREWFDQRNNLLVITWRQGLIFILLSYVVNCIFFWVLDDDGRKQFAYVTFSFGRLHSMMSITFFLSSLVFLSVGRSFQAYQSLLPGTYKVMRYYSSSLKTSRADDVLWPEKRLRMIRKWNDWALLAWLLTIRIISPPLRHIYQTLEDIKDEGYITEVEYECIIEEQRKKQLKNKDLSLVVFEWLVLLNEKSAPDYRIPNDFKNNFDTILALKKNGSNLIKFSTKGIPKLMVLAATLAVYIFGITSILGHNVVEFEKDAEAAVSTAAIIGAFIYPLIYAIPFLLYCVWLRYLRSTTDPFGWDDDDIDVRKIFKRHVENAKRFCNNPGAEYSFVFDQIN